MTLLLDSIIRKIINVQLKKSRMKKKSWRKAELPGSYQSLTVHNQIKQSVTEKWRNKAGSLTRCFVKFNFEEKTSIPNLVKETLIYGLLQFQ